MTIDEINYAIDTIKHECYVVNFLDLDRSTFINTALDTAIECLEEKRDELLEEQERQNWG